MMKSKKYHFRIVIEKAKGNYSAYSPDFPGCIATGRTIKETKKNIQDAIKSHLKVLKEDKQWIKGKCAK